MNWYRKLKKRLRDDEGSITVEFVVSVPLLLIALALGFAAFHAFLQYTRASKALYTVADLATQNDEIDTEMLTQLQRLLEASNAAPSGSVLRVSRIEYTAKASSPVQSVIDEGYEVADGYYTVAWSESTPKSTDIWCDLTDLTVSCLDAEVLTFPLRAEHLAEYDPPVLGDGAHFILVDVYTPYDAPLAGGFLSLLPSFDNVSWLMHVFIWPRNINGLAWAETI